MEDIEVIRRLDDIEGAARKIRQNASDEKDAVSKEMQEKTAKFDADLDADSARQISQVRARLESEMNAQLAAMEKETQKKLDRIQRDFADREEALSDEIVASLLK